MAWLRMAWPKSKLPNLDASADLLVLLLPSKIRLDAICLASLRPLSHADRGCSSPTVARVIPGTLNTVARHGG